MAKIDTIECRDMFTGLIDIPDASVGMLLTDPPYSSGGMFRGDRAIGTSDKYQRSESERKPEFYGDCRDERSFVLWSVLWLGECYRAMADGASAIVFSDWRQLSNVTDAVQAAGFVFRGIIPWRKTSPRPQPNSFRCECEYAVWATKGPIDRSPVIGAKYLPGAYKFAAPSGDERIHSTQKPLELIKALMEIAPEGCIVLDPFMGSGTTAVAAIETGRHFIGYELSPEYCTLANERVARAKSAGGVARMAKEDTLPMMYRPMMGRPSIKLPRCAVCGRPHPLEQHHVVFRSAGKAYGEDGRELEKPTITLCGFGNNLRDADGRCYCHGLAHHRQLHFRWSEDGWGHWEYLLLDNPTNYIEALKMDGWRRL